MLVCRLLPTISRQTAGTPGTCTSLQREEGAKSAGNTAGTKWEQYGNMNENTLSFLLSPHPAPPAGCFAVFADVCALLWKVPRRVFPWRRSPTIGANYFARGCAFPFNIMMIVEYRGYKNFLFMPSMSFDARLSP